MQKNKISTFLIFLFFIIYIFFGPGPAQPKRGWAARPLAQTSGPTELIKLHA
jgi:hypothetical protein